MGGLPAGTEVPRLSGVTEGVRETGGAAPRFGGAATGGRDAGRVLGGRVGGIVLGGRAAGVDPGGGALGVLAGSLEGGRRLGVELGGGVDGRAAGAEAGALLASGADEVVGAFFFFLSSSAAGATDTQAKRNTNATRPHHAASQALENPRLLIRGPFRYFHCTPETVALRAKIMQGESAVMIRLASLTICLAGAVMAQEAGKFGVFEGASDVGNPSQKGSVTYDAAKKEYRVTGGGNNIWAAKDDFYFVWKKLSANVILTATLKIDSAGLGHRKAGLMIRKDFETGSPYADIMVHGDGLTGLQYREKADDITRGVRFPISGPTRIRIERRGNAISVWAGKEGSPFQELGATDVGLGNPVYVGLAVCPHDDKASLTAVFSDVTLEILPPTPGPLPGQKKGAQKKNTK
jgi:regulation of enolase protein 1 (concanavalin A-like superfamily)